jgi:hypothetical protein
LPDAISRGPVRSASWLSSSVRAIAMIAQSIGQIASWSSQTGRLRKSAFHLRNRHRQGNTAEERHNSAE